jgi:hypothetical protein
MLRKVFTMSEIALKASKITQDIRYARSPTFRACLLWNHGCGQEKKDAHPANPVNFSRN